VRRGDRLTVDLFTRLMEEEYAKLRQAGNRDVHDDSKDTTLPIAREIVHALILAPRKSPWYIDLLNITLGNHDLAEARRRIQQYMSAFERDGTRVTANLDFDRSV
jgi:malate synthase